MLTKIGILGGMSWESSAIYYRLLNEGVRVRLGGLHSAPILLHSFDFAEIAGLQESGDWQSLGDLLAEGAHGLEQSGTQALLIATNTMHKVAERVEQSVGIPLLHIADATADRLIGAGVSRPLLLATRYTMEQEFYRGRLAKYGIETLVPDEDDRTRVHDIIYDELCRGIVRDESRTTYGRIVNAAVAQGADGVIFGCTEVGMLLSANDMPVPAFDTTVIHCERAVSFMMGEHRASKFA